jgi:ligand-binding sensor domain-containing protein/signal transduction histidine kinase
MGYLCYTVGGKSRKDSTLKVRVGGKVIQGAVRRLRVACILELLIVAMLLATACVGSTPSVSPGPAARLTQGTTPGERSQADDAQIPHPIPNSVSWARSGQRVRFEHISVEQGLSQSSVNCTLQDSKGFLWFGTDDGLNKHDGYSFTVYKHDPENPYSLSDNIVGAIYEDRSGGLWVGTAEGLNRYDRDAEQFIRYQHDPGDPHSLSNDMILSVLEDQWGMLWIGTGGGGLDRLDRETGSFVHHQHDPQDSHSLSDDVVRSLYEDRLGALWIGTGGGGLDRFDRENERFVHYQNDASDVHSLSHNVVLSIHEDHLGVLWIGTAGGLNEFDRDAERFTRYQHDPADIHSLSGDVVLSVFEDRAGDLWIGTNGQGLDCFDRSTGRFVHYQNYLSDPNGLSSDLVLSIYEDRSGVVWVGTRGGGLNKLDRSRQRFVHYWRDPNDPNSLNDNDIWAIYQDRQGVLWIGTQNGGLNRYDRATGTFTSYQAELDDPRGLGDDVVCAVYEDRAGRLWIGTVGGLYTLSREKETFKRWMSRNVVDTIYEDTAGALWIGTYQGLSRLDRDTETVIDYRHHADDPDGLISNVVRAVHEDRWGMLWVGTDSGLSRFDPDTERFIHFQRKPDDPNSLSDNLVMSIYQDPLGVLWVATYGGGLNKLVLSDTEGSDSGKVTFTHYREKDGLPSDAVYGILEDDQGHLWLSTNKGLSKFDPRTETFKNYDVSDGLQSNEFNWGAYHRSSGGEMFFGGINGVNAFYPVDIKENAFIPPIVLTSLTQSGEDVDLDQAVENVGQVTFNWPDNFFEFEFAALSYVQPEKNQYAYMLEGLDKDWNYTGKRRFGRYTNLSGGTYTLRIRGSNNDGLWNEEGLSAKIVVVPPFWETWWLRGLVALLLVGSVIGGYRLQVKTVEKRNLDLEAQVEERTRALEQRTGEIQRRRKELEALYRADAELHRRLSLDEVLQALGDIAEGILQADKTSLVVWDERRERLVVRMARGFRPETLAHMSFAPGEGTVGQVAATGEPVIVEDVLTDSRVLKRTTVADPEGIRSYMQVPIKIGGEVYGVFSADYTQPRAFGEDEQRLFISLAQRAALAIGTAQLYEQAQELAVAGERNRLARELHDAVTQTLFSSSLIAEALPALWESDQDEGRELLQELRRLSRGALAEMRTLLLELRPATLVEASLEDLLRQLGEAITGRTSLPVTVTVEGRFLLPDDIHVALYRIAQEALNNIVKHAQAGQVEVSLRCTSPQVAGDGVGRVELCIRDDGRGFDPSSAPSDRLGLGIMRERAQAIGAGLEIDSHPGSGTQVRLVWQGEGVVAT